MSIPTHVAIIISAWPSALREASPRERSLHPARGTR